MADLIVGGILLVIVGAAIIYIVKAKKSGIKCIGCPAAGQCSGANAGHSGGGGSVPRQKKVIGKARYRKVMKLEGLHCENCKNSVEKAIDSIEGAAAKVNLKAQTAEVVLEREVSDKQLREVVEEVGFRVIEVVNIS